MVRNLRELYQYRALLWNLTQRELKARYRGSFLGFLWTFLNPTLQMAVYGLFFAVLTQGVVPAFPYFMFVGLLPWICFSSSLLAGASWISDRRDLLTKVRFPAQVLPGTVMMSNLVNFLLSLPLMVGLGLIFHIWPTWHVVFFPVILMVQLLLTMALVYFFAALNVRFRDLQHILGNVVQLWFFVTPIAYTINQVPEKFRGLLMMVNPFAPIISAYQSIFYGAEDIKGSGVLVHHVPQAEPLLIVAGLSLFLLWAAATLFEGRREEFAEVA